MKNSSLLSTLTSPFTTSVSKWLPQFHNTYIQGVSIYMYTCLQLPPCTKMSHVTVAVNNPRWRPSVSVDAVQQQIAIFYRYNHNSESKYLISVKAVTDTNCTSTSTVVDESHEKTDNSDADGEYVDYNVDKTDEKKADISGETPANESAQDGKEAQDTNETQNTAEAQGRNGAQEFDETQLIKQKFKHAASHTAERLVSTPRTLRYGKNTNHCEFCCPGKGCPKVFHTPPHPRDFKPFDDESIIGQRRRKRL